MNETDAQIISGMTGVDKALVFAKRDGALRDPKVTDRVELANRLNVTNQAIYNFVQQGWMPVDRAKQVNEMYGVPIRELVRPDIRNSMPTT